MSKSLEDFIKKNRDAFDDKEPSERVWNNIESTLEKKQRNVWDSVMLWRAAAILFMGLSVYFFITRTSGETKQSASSITLQKDFTNLESFYSAEIASKVAM